MTAITIQRSMKVANVASPLLEHPGKVAVDLQGNDADFPCQLQLVMPETEGAQLKVGDYASVSIYITT